MEREAAPQRIICLTEEPTETLYLLGESERIVGISAYTVRPIEAAKDKPVVSAFVGGSVDKIVALEPDLVIGFSDVQAKLASELIRAGLNVLIFNQRSLEEILGVIMTLGRIVAREDAATELVSGYRARIAQIRASMPPNAARPRVYFEEWDEPQISAIRWVSELIEIAGGDDIFQAKSHGKAASERFVSSASVIEAAPDIILASWCGKPFDAAALCARPGWDSIPAVRAGRVYEIDASVILQPGPACFGDGLDALVERIQA